MGWADRFGILMTGIILGFALIELAKYLERRNKP
jgi:hypothetical protein